VARDLDSDTIAMLFDMGPAVKTAEDFGKALTKVGEAAFVAENALKKLDDQTDRVAVQIGTYRVNVDQADRGIIKLADGSEKLAASSRNMGRSMLESGRIIQDFSQGGLAGVLNNVEGLSLALGGGPGLAGVLTAVGVAAYFATPALKTLWKTVTDGANELPQSKDSVQQLNADLDTTRKRLEELRKEQVFTNKELAEYNKLVAAERTLEREAVAAKALAAPSKEAKRPGEDINKAIAELGGPAVRKAIEDALVSRQGDFGPEANQKFTQQLIGNVMAGQKDANQFLQDIMRGRGGQAERMIRGEPRFPVATGTGLTPAETERRERALEARRKAELAVAEGMGKGIELGEAQTAERRATEAGKFSRAATKDVAERAKATRGELGQLGGQEVKTRQEIARLQEDAHKARMMFGQGLATFEHTQQVVGQSQAQINQLQQQLARIHQRERQLEARQTILNRGK